MELFINTPHTTCIDCATVLCSAVISLNLAALVAATKLMVSLNLAALVAATKLMVSYTRQKLCVHAPEV